MICDAIADKGRTHSILPKSNTTCRNGSRQSWGEMARTRRDGPDRFMDEYRQRSVIEAVWGQSKRCTGITSGAGGTAGRSARWQSRSSATTSR